MELTLLHWTQSTRHGVLTDGFYLVGYCPLHVMFMKMTYLAGHCPVHTVFTELTLVSWTLSTTHGIFRADHLVGHFPLHSAYGTDST